MDLPEGGSGRRYLIDQVRGLFPKAFAEGILARVRSGKELFYGADNALASAGLILDDEDLFSLVMSTADRDYQAEAAASVFGPKLTGRLIDDLAELWLQRASNSKPCDESLSKRVRTLEGRLAHVPGSSLVAAVSERSAAAAVDELALYAELLVRHPDGRDERSRPFSESDLSVLSALAQDWGKRLLDQGASRQQIAQVVRLISHVPDVSLLPLLTRMLDDNLERYEAFRQAASAAHWKPGRTTQEAQMPLTWEYRDAFVSIDTAETRKILRRYLSHPHFGESAAFVLAKQWLSANQDTREEGVFGGVNFQHVRARRAIWSANADQSTEDADAIFDVVESLTAPGTSQAQHHLAIALTASGLLMPHGRRDLVLSRVLAFADRRGRARITLSRVLAGQPIPTSIIATGIKDTFEDAEKQSWILIESEGFYLREWLQLLPFADDLAEAVRVIRQIPTDHLPVERLDCVLAGLTLTPTEGAEEALFALAEFEPRLYGRHEWYRAVLNLGTLSSARRLIDLAADGAASGTPSAVRGWQWARDLGALLEKHSPLRAELYARLRSSSRSAGHMSLARGIAEVPDAEGLLLLVDLERAWGVNLVGRSTIERVSTEHVAVAEWNNAYSIVPIDVSALRKALLAKVGGDNPKDNATRALVLIDLLRDEHGRALTEVRHPDFSSGKAWPILSPDFADEGLY